MGLCEEGLGPRGLGHPRKSRCHQLQENVSTIQKLTRPQVDVHSGTHGHPALPFLDSMAHKGRQGCELSSAVAQQGLCPCVPCPGHCSTGAFQEAFPAQLGEGTPPAGVLEALVPGVKGRPARDRTKAGRGAGGNELRGGRHQEACYPAGLVHPVKRNSSAQSRSAQQTASLSPADYFLDTLSTQHGGQGGWSLPSPFSQSHSVARSPLLGGGWCRLPSA